MGSWMLLIRYNLFTSDWLWNEVCQNAVFGKIDITMTTKNFKIDKIRITTGNVRCGVFFVDWATLGWGKFDLGANAPCPGAVTHSVWWKEVFWTQWLEEMFISSNMRGDIWLWNVYCGAAMIEVCLWSKKSAIRWVFGPSRQSPDRQLFFCAAFTSYCWFSLDVTKIQTKKLSILPRFYFYDVLEQQKTNFHTNSRFKRVLGFVIEYACISKLLREAAFTWRPIELSCRLQKWLISGNFSI